MILELACEKCGSHRLSGPSVVHVTGGDGPITVDREDGPWRCANCDSPRLVLRSTDLPLDSEPEQDWDTSPDPPPLRMVSPLVNRTTMTTPPPPVATGSE